MKHLPIALLGGFVTSVCLAAPNARLDNDRLVIGGVSVPHSGFVSAPSNAHVTVSDDIVTPAPEAVSIPPKAAYRPAHIYGDGSGRSDSRLPLNAVSAKPVAEAPKAPEPILPTTFFVRQGEPPYHAITRWLGERAFHQAAFSFDDGQKAQLMQPSEEALNFTGTLPESVVALGEQLSVPLAFDMRGGIAAIHTFEGAVDIRWVKGASLKAATARLAEEYDWRWQEQGAQPSWLSHNDYPLMSEYGIVTPHGAFDVALNTLLEGYPVQAQLIPSSRTLFIVERE